MGRVIVLLGVIGSAGCYQAVDNTRREAELQRITVDAWNARGDLPYCNSDCLQGIWGLEIVHTDTAGMFFVCGAGRDGCYNSRKYFAFNTDHFADPGVQQSDKDWVVLHETVHALGDYSGLGDSDHNHSDTGRRWGMWRDTVLYEAYVKALGEALNGKL